MQRKASNKHAPATTKVGALCCIDSQNNEATRPVHEGMSRTKVVRVMMSAGLLQAWVTSTQPQACCTVCIGRCICQEWACNCDCLRIGW